MVNRPADAHRRPADEPGSAGPGPDPGSNSRVLDPLTAYRVRNQAAAPAVYIADALLVRGRHPDSHIAGDDSTDPPAAVARARGGLAQVPRRIRQ